MLVARRLTVLVALIATGALPTSALAAPPANDAYANATVIKALPFSAPEDLSEATAGEAADTAGLNACAATGFGVDRSVWLDFRAHRAQRVTLSTVGAAPNYGAIVARGSPASFTPVACTLGQSRTTFTALPGQRYHVALAAVGPAKVTVSMRGAPPPATLVTSPIRVQGHRLQLAWTFPSRGTPGAFAAGASRRVGRAVEWHHMSVLARGARKLAPFVFDRADRVAHVTGSVPRVGGFNLKFRRKSGFANGQLPACRGHLRHAKPIAAGVLTGSVNLHLGGRAEKAIHLHRKLHARLELGSSRRVDNCVPGAPVIVHHCKNRNACPGSTPLDVQGLSGFVNPRGTFTVFHARSGKTVEQLVVHGAPGGAPFIDHGITAIGPGRWFKPRLDLKHATVKATGGALHGSLTFHGHGKPTHRQGRPACGASSRRGRWTGSLTAKLAWVRTLHLGGLPAHLNYGCIGPRAG